MRYNAVRSLAIVCLLAGPPAVQAQPPHLVADLNVDALPLQFWDQRDEMETAGGLVFFAADDGIHGKELWASGNQVTSFTHNGQLSIANGRIYFTTYDNTLYCFGFPMEH